MKIVLVAAVGENGVIGRDNGLPWRLRSDLKHFRAVTIGKPVVMGRKTYLSLGQPLKGRTNIVISRDPDFAAPGVLAVPTLEAGLAAARGDALRRGASEIIIGGGAEIYAQTMAIADCLVITQVHAAPPGQALFPTIDPGMWQETERIEHEAGPHDEANFAFVTYARRLPRSG
jgi:dihydrofolate reductase